MRRLSRALPALVLAGLALAGCENGRTPAPPAKAPPVETRDNTQAVLEIKGMT